jgi:hypothetical protein
LNWRIGEKTGRRKGEREFDVFENLSKLKGGAKD